MSKKKRQQAMPIVHYYCSTGNSYCPLHQLTIYFQYFSISCFPIALVFLIYKKIIENHTKSLLFRPHLKSRRLFSNLEQVPPR